MKGKVSNPRHKEENVFKFQSFSQRIAEIKVDVYHRIKHAYEEDSEEETYLFQALEKWTTLNCSQSFVQLRKELTFNIKTLPQVIKQKEHIVQVLLKNLEAGDHLNIETVLELVVAGAKDLRQELYPYYPQLHAKLLALLNTRNSDQLEWTFRCLAYLFKFLWRCLVSDLQNIFESFLPLLSSSKPTYINNFAAESFAFVARKVKDQKKFLNLTLQILKKHPDGVEGCGRLLFEVVKGIQGQFHSCAEATLTLYLESLADDSVPYKVLCPVLVSAYLHIISKINVKHASIVWSTLQNTLSKFILSWKSEPSDLNVDRIKQVLNIIKMGVKHKSGAFLKDVDPILDLLLKLIQPTYQMDYIVTNEVTDILTLLLLSENILLSQETASRIVVSAMSFLTDESLLSFVEKVMKYPGFNGLVLPRLLDYSSAHPAETTLPLLTKIILLHSPPAPDTGQLTSFTPYSLDFPAPKKGLQTYGAALLKNISGCCVKYYIHNTESVVSSLLLLPHIQKVRKEEVIENLKYLICKLSVYLRNKDSCCEKSCDFTVGDEDTVRLSVLLLVALSVESVVNLNQDCITELCDPREFVEAVLPYCVHPENISALRALDFFITADEGNKVASFHSVIKEKLWENLMSPYHKVRLLTSHILYELEKGNEEGSGTMLAVLEACWKCESSGISLSEYREKLKFAQLLEPGGGSGVEKPGTDVRLPLAHLLGLHFVNFKLLWAPLSKLVVSYARCFSTQTFWPVFHSFLRKVSFNIRENKMENNSQHIFKDNDVLSSMYDSLHHFSDNPDYINCRILLWNAMKDFSDLCELKNRDVVSEFILFLEQEYYKLNPDSADAWNVKICSNNESENVQQTGNDSVNLTMLDSDEEMEVDETEHTDDNNDTDENAIANSLGKNYKWATRSLLGHLQLFSQMKNPKSFYKEGELYNHYTKFLCNKTTNVQKAALDCLMAYKFKFLVPYKDHLYGLIDDKSFKHEINLFRLNSESELIRPEHREELIPIVLRIVSTKMFAKLGKGVKDSKMSRKATVIRFLAGCTPVELETYFNMAFSFFISQLKDDAVNMVNGVIMSVDLENTVPPRKLQSSVDLMKIIIVNSGGILEQSTLSKLLRIIIIQACHVVVSLVTLRNQVNPMYFRTYKWIRKSLFDTITWFYEKLSHYQWTTSETDAVFQVFVWPWLDKLVIEGVYSPTSLLKLFSVWGQNPRYFQLLGKCKEDSSKLCPLGTTMKLWLTEKLHKSVINTIMDMVENLLTLVPSDDSPMIEISPTILDVKNVSIKGYGRLNLGSQLMLEYVEAVLERIKRHLLMKTGMPQRDLEVLSRVTELLTGGTEEAPCPAPEVAQNEMLLSLLVPVLVKRASAPEHIIIPLITGVKNLIKAVPTPGKHLRSLIPLLFKINGPVPRKILISTILKTYKDHKRGSDCVLDCKVIEDLNSYNVKWLDQPDFIRRLDAFKEIENLLKENKISLDLGLIIIYTSYYFLLTEKDLSLRDNASQCLRSLCPALANNCKDLQQEKQFLVDQTILFLIKEGIKNMQEEFIRNESIVLLGYMVRECSDLHPVLRDLAALSNKQDMEVDFFENMQHLQHHRRLRAMQKFTEIAKEYTKVPNPRALTQFILPMITYYLCNETYANRPTVIDTSVKALATSCRLLPWHQYLGILKYYLKKLQGKSDYQKQLLRINIEILNAFHFDLYSADTEEFLEPSEKDTTNKKIEENKSTDKGDEENKEEEIMGKEEDGTEDDEFEDKEMELGEENIEEEDSKEEEIVTIKAIDKIIKLPKSGAARVTGVIRSELLPQLQRCMAQRSQADDTHKVNRKKGGVTDSDEQDMMRIPLAVAFVKLLQKLPPYILDANLPGVIMKVVGFLKSRVEAVRRVSRQTLQEIAVSLGPSKLPTLIREMSAVLTKGFYIHVLAYSMNAVLTALKPHYQKGDVDQAVHLILEICKLDLFGDSSEEKEVGQIIGRVMEAGSCKSYNAFNIMANFITEGYLLDILIPLKEELSKTLSHKTVHKVSECLRLTVLGLTENNFLSPESLLEFVYGIASESIVALAPNNDVKPVDQKLEEWKSRRRQDYFIVPAEPKRQKAAEVRVCAKTNAHLLVEFGLHLLYFLLRREKVNSVNHRSLLDPMVKLLLDCLKSHHVKVSTMALKCLIWVMKFDLPSLRENIKELADIYFSILHKYAAAGLSKGDNFDLVLVTFKAVAVLVKEVRFHQLDTDQLRALLLYCEQDLDDHSRQATAFSLLKAIIVRKIKTPELEEVIRKIAILSVIAELDSVRLQARQVMHSYIMEYPLGKKLNKHLGFYYAQLSYNNQSGRESVLAMLKTFVGTFPIETLNEGSAVMFVNLCPCLVNDPSPECRKTVADIIIELLSRLDVKTRDQLFDITEMWINERKVSTRRLAAQLFGLFVQCEKSSFKKRVNRVLPILVDQFITNYNRPGRFVLLQMNTEIGEEEEETNKDRLRDHLLFQVLQTLIKISSHVPETLTHEEDIPHWTSIVQYCQSFLNHPHEWVRLGSVQLLGLIVCSVEPSVLAESVSTSVESAETPTVSNLFSVNTRSFLRSITLDVLAQLVPNTEINDKFLLQCMKLLVRIAEILKDVKEENNEEMFSLLWLVKKVRKLINAEIIQAPTSITVRTMCFNWMAAITTKLDREAITSVSYHMVAPLVREVSLGVEGDNEQLMKVAREVLSYIKKNIGKEKYNIVMSQATTKLDIKRAERKKERAQLVVTDPVRAAKRKINKQLKKKNNPKKKKLSTHQRVKKKKKNVDLED